MKIGAQDIFAAAKAQGRSAAAIALLNGQRPDRNMWPEITKDFDESLESYSDVDLLSIPGIKGTFLEKYSVAMAESIQFPKSTAFMHLLGCLSTACSHRFSTKYYGEDLHIGLYIIGAQPPSAGKSAINKNCRDQISVAFDRVNKAHTIERAKINKRIAQCEEEIKQKGNSINPNELDALLRSMDDERDKLQRFPIFRYNITDATPEALSAKAAEASGNFTLVSDEATVINTALGLSYGSEANLINNETILKGWDGGLVSTARISRDTPEFFARGAISVIAQSETILSILKAGERGNGLTERFMFINERPMIGSRQYVDENGNMLYQGIPGEMKTHYSQLVNELVVGEPVILSMKPSASAIIAMQKQIIEPKLADNGEYGNNLLRGVMGKMDKQVCKIASVIHLANNWLGSNGNATTIGDDTVLTAIALFNKLSETFIGAAQSEGYAGHDAESKKVLEKIIKDAAGGKVVQFVKVYQALRNVVPFKGAGGLADKLRDKILPDLEANNYIVCVGKDIHVNPGLL